MLSVQSTFCKSARSHSSGIRSSSSYDPEYQHWDFGKISALRETALALEAGYDYYYMGSSSTSSLRSYVH